MCVISQLGWGCVFVCVFVCVCVRARVRVRVCNLSVGMGLRARARECVREGMCVRVSSVHCVCA